METYINLSGSPIAYELKRSLRATRLRLAVYPGGRLVVSAPYLASRRRIEAALEQKSDWIRQKVKLLKDLPPLRKRATRADYLKHKAAALALVGERLEHFNEAYGFSYGKITIRDQKSRWGSCSKQGNLSFNYRLALLPKGLADYVIVHELCHRGRFDHSPKFWQLVERAIPDYKARRAELKKRGRSLD